LSPRSEQQAVTATAIVLVAVGCLAWWLSLRPVLDVDSRELAGLPSQVDSWISIEVPLDSAVESMLQADFNLQRTYVHPLGDVIWFYVGYYGTARGGRPEHTPRGCYTGAGWGIESSRTIELDSNEEFRANEYLVEQHGEQRLVHFWYRSHRRTGILGGLDQNIDRLLGRLLDGRADGALVRISTQIIGDDTTAARGRLLSFASLVDPLLGEHWPIEFTCEEPGSEACATKSDSDGAVVSSAGNPRSLRL
jgi:EpsI family protein